MRILFIAPLPPPLTGQSLASRILYEFLIISNKLVLVDQRKKSFKEGIDSFFRIFEILKLLFNVTFKFQSCDVIYLTVSESISGNIKDLCIYSICYFRLKNVVIHLHGGTIRRELWNENRLLFKINSYFLKRIGGIIITGKSHQKIYDDFINPDRIHIIPNFAQDYLFVDEGVIYDKFLLQNNKVKILYISNMIPKKGYMQLLSAFLTLDESIKNHITIDFAGGFDSELAEVEFLNKICDQHRITYHGVVNGFKKEKLFRDAHIFCLPTTYLEGQPISILEAYASGCVIMTTGQPGILDIFEHKKNGFQILPNSQSIASTIVKIIAKKSKLFEIGLENNRQARLIYRTQKYSTAVEKVLGKFARKNSQ